MQLSPTATKPAFVPVQALAPVSGPAPKTETMPWDSLPHYGKSFVTVKYTGTTTEGKATTVSLSDNRPPTYGYELVRGSLDDAIRAARELVLADEQALKTEPGKFFRSSVAVLDAGKGQWALGITVAEESPGDEMTPLISLPIDTVPASKSEASVPYGAWNDRDGDAHGFDAPAKIQVRFNDPQVAALVGRDSVALAPGR